MFHKLLFSIFQIFLVSAKLMVQIYTTCEIMDDPDALPFKPEQLAESRSFKAGFRGAWFRCKIKHITAKKFDGPIYGLEYYDFPEEKLTLTRAYQKPQRSKMSKPELILRPQYPPSYKECDVPDANTISEVTVVRNNEWKIGDEVDWFTDGCYWSGRVTKILAKGKVQMELPPPPAGEGLIYDVPCKDLRPSLIWSLKDGWSVPVSKEGENHHPCARLIKPDDKGPKSSKIGALNEKGQGFPSIAGSSFDSSFSSDTPSSLLRDVDKPKEGPQKSEVIGRASRSDSVSTSQIRKASARTNGDDEDNSSEPTKRLRAGGSIPLNSMQTDTLEATFLDLEELVNKVKWLKGILQYGTSLSNARRPEWKFLEHRGSSLPK